VSADIVLVEWLDAHGPPDNGASRGAWIDPLEAAKHHEPSRCFSVGWILKSDSTGISLFASVADDADVGEVSFIYRGMIKKVTVLKKARKKG